MKKARLEFITIHLLPEEAKVLKCFCQKIGVSLHWHFAEVEGFENEDRTVDILFDILQTIEEARTHQDAETFGKMTNGKKNSRTLSAAKRVLSVSL